MIVSVTCGVNAALIELDDSLGAAASKPTTPFAGDDCFSSTNVRGLETVDNEAAPGESVSSISSFSSPSASSSSLSVKSTEPVTSLLFALCLPNLTPGFALLPVIVLPIHRANSTPLSLSNLLVGCVSWKKKTATTIPKMTIPLANRFGNKNGYLSSRGQLPLGNISG